MIGCSKPDSSNNSSEDYETLKAKEKLLDVEVTLPASLVSDSEDPLDEEAKAAGVKKIVKNDDGSITLKMTKAAHRQLLSDFKDSIDDGIDEILEDKENYPSFDSITYNDDLTEFTVNVDPNTYNEIQSLAALVFYIEGNIYQALNAVPENQLATSVNFIDNSCGEILHSYSADSVDDFKKQLDSLEHTDKLTKESSESIKQDDSQDSTTDQAIDNNFIASYLPVDGTYVNSTNGGLPNSCEIKVTKESDNSFRFSIWQIIDENGNGTNKIIFMENIAVFDSPDATTAVFRGQTYTVYFDCSEPFHIYLSGFDQATSLSNRFLNMAAYFDSVYVD